MEVIKLKNNISFQLTEPIKITLDLFIKDIKNILKVPEVGLYFLIEDGKLIKYKSSSNPEEIEDKKDLMIVSDFFNKQENIYINLDSPLAKKYELEQPIIVYNLATPEGELGTILIKGYKEKQFFDTDFRTVKNIFASFTLLVKGSILFKKNLFIPFSNTLLLLLENSHLIHTFQDMEKKFYSLLEVSNLINSSKKLEEMVQNVLESATKVLRAESASVFLVDPFTGDLVFDIITGHSNLKGIRIPRGKGIAGKCALTKQSCIVNDVRNHPDFYQDVDKISQITTRNLMACPLIVDGEVIGVIEVINTIDRSEFSNEDLQLFQSFSDSVAIALQRRKLMDYIENANIQLEQKVRELTTLHKVSQILVEQQDIYLIGEQILSIIQQELKIGKLSLFLYDYNTHKFYLIAKKGFDVYHEDIHPNLMKFVFDQKIPFYIKNFDELPELESLRTPSRYKTKSAIIIPLIKSNSTPFGILCATEPLTKEYFETEDFSILLTISSQFSKTYENIELTGIQKEIEITAKIQKNILPNYLQKHKAIEYSAKTIPAKTTGGDFFDYYMKSTYGNSYFIIADVSGKSLPAALFMAICNSIIRTVMRQEEDPAKILKISNELLFEESESGMFVTVFLVKYNSIKGSLEYASAGHNNMILIHEDNTFDLLSAKGIPLGVVNSKDVQFEKKEIQLRKNDILVLYTDGVVEATNKKNEEYGLERLIQQIIKYRNHMPDEIIHHIFDDVKSFTNKESPDDDFTLVISKFNLKYTNNHFSIILPAKKESVPKLINELSEIFERYNLPEMVLNDLLLTCDEISTNICFYAYKDMKVEKPYFKCRVVVNPKNITITFIDTGKEYDFYNIQKPDLIQNLLGQKEGGFGIYLVNTLMDKAIYRRINNKNYLTIIKNM